MKKGKVITICGLVIALVVSMFMNGVSAADAKDAGGNAAQPGLSREAMYEWNLSKAYVVTDLDEVSEGKCHIHRTYSPSAAPDWDTFVSLHSYYRVRYYYGEEEMRLRALMKDPNALIKYNTMRIQQSRGLLSKSVYHTYEECVQSALSAGAWLNYNFMLDWEYRSEVKPGDTVIMAVDNGMEPWGEAYAVVQPYPFTEEHTKPYLAKFIDGKLQLDEDIADAFMLYRLYDDTYPELTGIKDGDSVEDVVNFLKAVEQDMVRYEQELKQLPASTDVSSIR